MDMDKPVLLAAAAGAAAFSGLYCAWKGATKESRKLAITEQIKVYAALYARAVDRVDAELMREPFTKDATMDIPNLPGLVNPETFSRECTKYLSMKCVATQHCLCNHIVQVSDDLKTAHSEIGFQAHHWKKVGTGKECKIENAGSNGRYLDKWVMCPDGKMRIAERMLVYDYESDLWDKSMKDETKNRETGNKIRTVLSPSKLGNFGSHGMDDISYEMFGKMINFEEPPKKKQACGV